MNYAVKNIYCNLLGSDRTSKVHKHSQTFNFTIRTYLKAGAFHTAEYYIDDGTLHFIYKQL